MITWTIRARCVRIITDNIIIIIIIIINGHEDEDEDIIINVITGCVSGGCGFKGIK